MSLPAVSVDVDWTALATPRYVHVPALKPIVSCEPAATPVPLTAPETI